MLYLCLTSCPTRSALCWIAALCYIVRQKQKPCVSAAEGSGLPELRRSRDAAQPQQVEAHTLTRIETYQLHCRSRAEMHCKVHMWLNLGVNDMVSDLCTDWLTLGYWELFWQCSFELLFEQNQCEDVTLGSGKMRLAFSTLFWHFMK